MTVGKAIRRLRSRITSPLAEVALATSAATALGAGFMALAGFEAAAGMLWVAAFYAVIGATSIIRRLRHIAFAEQLSREEKARPRSSVGRAFHRSPADQHVDRAGVAC